jgi:hypothetical protein
MSLIYFILCPLSTSGHASFVVDGARGGAPEGKRNGNYRHGARTKEMIELWRFIKSLS